MFEKVLCDDCIHCSVCKHSDEYKVANEAVKETMVHFGDNRMIRLRDISWIKHGLSCNYYAENRNSRTLQPSISIPTGTGQPSISIASGVINNEDVSDGNANKINDSICDRLDDNDYMVHRLQRRIS